MQKKQFICFSLGGTKNYVVEAAQLLGIAKACPFTSYPQTLTGLVPKGIVGLAEWAGKIFPILNLQEIVEPPNQSRSRTLDLSKCTYLFYKLQEQGAMEGFAFAVPCGVQVCFLDQLKKGDFLVLDLTQILKTSVFQLSSQEDHKIAA